MLGVMEKRVFLALAVALGLLAIALLPLGAGAIAGTVEPADSQCRQPDPAAGAPAAAPASPADYLALGDAAYERGDCAAAVEAYSRAIDLDPADAEAYNNRAYVRMRQQRYADALPDLDRAIALRPTYVHALMNRGDIYNYYYAIDRARAVADYDRIIAQGPAARRGTSVCGHRMLALNDGWGPRILVDMLSGGLLSGCRDGD